MLQKKEKNAAGCGETCLLEELLLAVRDIFDGPIVQIGDKAFLHLESGLFCLTMQKLR